ncbi:hypothetical protein ACFWXK_10125 [Streptomyces sp. NPDC059070]|uniref:hypothetical protein n=1 Tax=Streptomyces sp. NPDC059070 TaxID=3346713 RepID=UPI0036B89C5A
MKKAYMAEISGELGEYRLRKGGHEFGTESLGDELSRLAGFTMLAGGAGAAVIGHSEGAATALAGVKIAKKDPFGLTT